MLKQSLLFAACTMAFTTALANDVDVKTFRYAGPFDLPAPVLIDSTDAQQKRFASESLLNTPLHLSLAQQGRIVNTGNAPTSAAPYALHLLQFNIQNAAYRKVGIELKGLKHYQVYVDNKLVSPSDVALQPQTHNVVIKYLSQKDSTYNLSVRLTNVGDSLTTNTDTPNAHAERHPKRPAILSPRPICQRALPHHQLLRRDGRRLHALFVATDRP